MWAAWADEWLLYDKVSFDGINKIIYVHPEVTTLDIRADVYTSWIDWVALYQNSEFLLAIRYTGLDPIGAGVYTGDTYFLINGWKLSINLQQVKVTGVLFSDDYDTAYYTTDLVAQYPATVSSLVTTVSTGGGTGGATPAEIWAYNNKTLSAAGNSNIASAVRTNLTTELSQISHINSTQLTLEQIEASLILAKNDVALAALKFAKLAATLSA